MKCKYCEKAHDPLEEHPYLGRCRLEGCGRCADAFALHLRTRTSARAAGIRLTKDDPDEAVGKCLDCHTEVFAGTVVPTGSVADEILTDVRQRAMFEGLPKQGPGVGIWAWLQDAGAKGGAQWSVEHAEGKRPAAKCPRCRKAKAA